MKQNIRTIVVGVDLSKYSKVVVKEAQALASKWGVKVKYLFVRSEVWEPKEFSTELTALYRKQVQKLYKISNLSEVVIRYGKPAAEIINFAKTVEQPMIMVGHRGFNPFFQMFLGSTAESIALSSPYPVWIHRGAKVVFPEKILVPSDLSIQTDQTLKGVESLHSAFQKKVELFHVSKEPMAVTGYPEWSNLYGKMKEVEYQRINTFKRNHPDLQLAETMGSVAAKIQERAKKFDLIALTPNDRTHDLPLFGSVTARLVRSGNKPVIICP